MAAGAGAGRKSEATLFYQASRRGQVEDVITPEKWASCIRAMVREAVKGNVRAFEALTPWVMGAVPQKVEIDIEAHIRALAVIRGVDPDRAVLHAQRILEARQA